MYKRQRYRSREESSPYLLDILTPTSFDREAFDDYRRCLRKPVSYTHLDVYKRQPLLSI